MSDFAEWLSRRNRPLRRIAVLTGAGISAESGVPTFRGHAEVWQGRDPVEIFTPEALTRDPADTWSLYDTLRTRIAAAQPNAGHLALAHLAHHRAVVLATQNIDGLHQRAGNREVLELHGTLWRLRCTRCSYTEENATVPLAILPPSCPTCMAMLRPDIVLYSEPLPGEVFIAAECGVEAADLLLVIGTSGVVYPAAGLPLLARTSDIPVVEINPTATPLSSEADYCLRTAASLALPEVVEAILAHNG